MPRLDGEMLRRGLRAVRALKSRGFWGLTLAAMSTRLQTEPDNPELAFIRRARLDDGLLEFALKRAGENFINDWFVARALQTLAPVVSGELLVRAVELALGISGDVFRRDVLSTLLDRLDNPARRTLLERADAHPAQRARLLQALAPYLNGALLEERWRAASAQADPLDRARSLLALLDMVEDRRALLREVRRLVMDYIDNRKNGDRSWLLHLCSDSAVCSTPTISEGAIEAVGNHVMEICQVWGWALVLSG